MHTAAELEADERIYRKDSFSKWMDQPATRMMLSMIPPSEKQEVLGTLLQETFNAGYNAGAGKTAGTFLEALLKGMDKKRPAD